MIDAHCLPPSMSLTASIKGPIAIPSVKAKARNRPRRTNCDRHISLNTGQWERTRGNHSYFMRLIRCKGEGDEQREGEHGGECRVEMVVEEEERAQDARANGEGESA